MELEGFAEGSERGEALEAFAVGDPVVNHTAWEGACEFPNEASGWNGFRASIA